MKANSKYKDGIFRAYFNDPEKLKSLYCALSGMKCEEIHTIEIKNLENVIYGELKNDIAFTVNDQLVIMAEHQSTICRNMPLRMLSYCTGILESMTQGSDVYRSSLKKIPAPEFYVFYNGEEKLPVKSRLKLSDAFLAEPNQDCSLELSVMVINVNYDAGSEVLRRCTEMNQYALLIHHIRRNLAQGKDLDSAIGDAIKYCKTNGIMVEFLQEHGKEAETMLNTEISREEWGRIIAEDKLAEGIAMGKAEGIAMGKAEGIATVACSMKVNGYSVADIARLTGLSPEEIEAL